MRKKVLLIIGAGTGVGLATAKKFINEDFKVLLLSRNQYNLDKLKRELSRHSRDVETYVADITDEKNLTEILETISIHHRIDVLLYNVAHIVKKNILEEASECLVFDYRCNVVGLLTVIKTLLKRLTETEGTILVTGGGIAIQPKPAYASSSIASAALRSMVHCFDDSLKQKNIFIALLMVNHRISEYSLVHNPENIANIFWGIYKDRSVNEVLI